MSMNRKGGLILAMLAIVVLLLSACTAPVAGPAAPAAEEGSEAATGLRFDQPVQGPPGGLQRDEARVVADRRLHQRDHRLDLRERRGIGAVDGQAGARGLGRGQHGGERVVWVLGHRHLRIRRAAG